MRTVPAWDEAIRTPECYEKLPMMRYLDENSEVVAGATLPVIGTKKLVQIYECMVKLQTMDELFYGIQRQGRISFYMSSAGEEAASVATSAALELGDVIMAQYREQVRCFACVRKCLIQTWQAQQIRAHNAACAQPSHESASLSTTGVARRAR